MPVKIGKITIGGKYPVVVQSMTSTDTNDIEESVDQCIRIAEAGGKMVRLTVQGLKEVESLSRIRRILFEKGYNFPLIADVHFHPRAAEEAAKIVEKVRINPGNYSDKKLGVHIELNDKEYAEELNAIRQKIKPLLIICKERGTALRIGVNHGSLSDRIMSRYGDTPEGMAESAMEFIRICHKEGFLNLVVSMKASNTRIMAYACRLLFRKMKLENLIFPIHLGVTEAGSGKEGRVRSAVGIASLLQQGIGDTIRVSLTEDPEDEIPAALEIAKFFGNKNRKFLSHGTNDGLITQYKKRESLPILKIGGEHPPVVISDQTHSPAAHNKTNHLRVADLIYYNNLPTQTTIHPNQPALVPAKQFQSLISHDNIFPLGNFQDYFAHDLKTPIPFFLLLNPGNLNEIDFQRLKKGKHIIIVAEVSSSPDPHKLLNLFQNLEKYKIKFPVILKIEFRLTDPEKLLIRAAGESGLFFLDGLADGLWLSNQGSELPLTDLSFDILQASRVRTTTTEFISCPSCGRTLFDIKNILKEVKQKTAHLTGLKIAVMGCIVNGPGEMADADYGYVGSGPGKVSLYRNKKAVIKNIPQEYAIEKLIELIKSDGKWIEV